MKMRKMTNVPAIRPSNSATAQIKTHDKIAVAEAPETKPAEAKPVKTFLVTYGVATEGDSGEREDLSLGLVEASDLDEARKAAWEQHIHEWEEGDWGGYTGSTGERGRAFKKSANYGSADANTIYYIDTIEEIPAEDGAVLTKYLGCAHAETAEEYKERMARLRASMPRGSQGATIKARLEKLGRE